MKNKLTPFNPKVQNYINLSLQDDTWLNIAEGAKRAGKNVANIIAFCLAVDYSPDPIHLVAGVTLSTAIQNVIDSNGYGILNFFHGKIKKQKINERLSYTIIDSKGRNKTIIVLGGGKKGDETKIRGNSYGCVYLTEANLLNEDFIKESIDRTINSKYKKVFHDLNPMWAEHWYYNNILNSYKGINYCHFVITDNNALSDDVIKKLFSEYNKDSVWFKRDILGQRIASEGIIFKQINERPADYIANYEQVKKCHKIIIGLDFGGSKSNTAIVACGFFDKTIIVIKSILIPTNSTIVFIAQKLKEFISDLKQITTARIVSVQADNENQIAIATLLTYRLGVPILNCNKRKIIERIRLKEKLLNSKQYFFYMPDAKTALESSKRQLWSDKNRDTRLDDGLIDIDSADAEEYCWTSIPFLFI